MMELAVDRIHLFVAGQKNRARAVPLRKDFIISYSKCPPPSEACVSVSYDWGRTMVELARLPYSFVVNKESGTLVLPKSEEDATIVKYISSFPETLDSLGLKMRTGLVIDSKCEELLFSEAADGFVPVLRPATIVGGGVKFPQPIKKQYLAAIKPQLLQKNKNMILIKRVPAVSDERYLNAAVYLASGMPAYKYISTHNKVNFIDTKAKEGEMCARFAFGLFALLNSTVYDRYLSIVSKSKQINAKEMQKLPLPPRNIIENIGTRLMELRSTSVKACDQIVNPTLHIRERSS